MNVASPVRRAHKRPGVPTGASHSAQHPASTSALYLCAQRCPIAATGAPSCAAARTSGTLRHRCPRRHVHHMQCALQQARLCGGPCQLCEPAALGGAAPAAWLQCAGGASPLHSGALLVWCGTCMAATLVQSTRSCWPGGRLACAPSSKTASWRHRSKTVAAISAMALIPSRRRSGARCAAHGSASDCGFGMAASRVQAAWPLTLRKRADTARSLSVPALQRAPSASDAHCSLWRPMKQTALSSRLQAAESAAQRWGRAASCNTTEQAGSTEKPTCTRNSAGSPPRSSSRRSAPAPCALDQRERVRFRHVHAIAD